ncbi:zinc ribbon domain-containing protein [Paenibacillus humicus]|uniref:zinc ribbon domain-containing protein n=1 Tax=Paenibacillus humicus TaxID=412861 RepID=UPI000FD9C7B4|nr:hypothetical protein [Paenibacillus humicus]
MIKENVFQVRAENLTKEEILQWTSFTEKDQFIIKKLQGNSSKLLVGPRGSGKSMLMRWAYYSSIENEPEILPIYINFEKYLYIEPILHQASNGNVIFTKWVLSKVITQIVPTLVECNRYDSEKFSKEILDFFKVDIEYLQRLTYQLEGGSAIDRIEELTSSVDLSVGNVIAFIKHILDQNNMKRAILLLDDAAHAFSPRLQKEFFEIFRVLKSREVSAKAAVYPGLTNYSPYFNIGHDALFLDVGYSPDEPDYISFFDDIMEKRFGDEVFTKLKENRAGLNNLYYAANGIPRGLIVMVEFLLDDNTRKKITQREYYDAIDMWTETVSKNHDSLKIRIPRYKNFVDVGSEIMERLLELIKEYNKGKDKSSKAVYIGISNPISAELQKVIDFLEYSGLLREKKNISKGIKGVYTRYLVHLGKLIQANSFAEGKTKTLAYSSDSISNSKLRQFARIQADRIFSEEVKSRCQFDLPPCNNCGAPRASEQAKFCTGCGAELRSASIFYEIIEQEIDVLPLTSKRIQRIKIDSEIRTIKDILMDENGIELKKVQRIGAWWADKIRSYAEEFIGG